MAPRLNKISYESSPKGDEKSSDFYYGIIPIAVLMSLFAFLTLIGLVAFIGELVDKIELAKITEAEHAALIKEILLEMDTYKEEILRLNLQGVEHRDAIETHKKAITHLIDTTNDLNELFSPYLLLAGFSFIALKVALKYI